MAECPFCVFCMSKHIFMSDQNSDVAGHVHVLSKEKYYLQP